MSKVTWIESVTLEDSQRTVNLVRTSKHRAEPLVGRKCRLHPNLITPIIHVVQYCVGPRGDEFDSFTVIYEMIKADNRSSPPLEEIIEILTGVGGWKEEE